MFFLWPRPPPKGGMTSTATQLLPEPPLRRLGAVHLRSHSARYVAGVLALGAAYYAAAKLGQTLRYTASVSAIWPPAGLGIAALYLWGLRWWPGVLVGELAVNGELLAGQHPLPVLSLLGQQTGNIAEILVGALLLAQLVGAGAKLDRVDQVRGVLVAVGIATAISATVGTLSMVAGGVIEPSEASTFWRTWWLGDTSGGLIVVPLILAWAANPAAARRRICSWEGGVMIAVVALIAVVAVSTDEPVTYLVFPVLIWAALRFGPLGATLSIVIAAGIAIGVTANDVGPFSKQPIDHKTLSTQLYIGVAALTTLLLTAVVSERERASMELAEAKRREGERAVEERHRIARDLHDSVSQALFSTVLHTRTVQKALEKEGIGAQGPLGRALEAIADLTRGAQSEMRAFTSELGRDPIPNGLLAALDDHAARLAANDGLRIDVKGPEGRLPLSPRVEGQLFAIGREALANTFKHSGAERAWVRVEGQQERVLVEIRDGGRGFDPNAKHPGHFGLHSMRSRAAEIGAALTIASRLGQGTVVRVEAPADANGARDGA
jgi:signal transduction histidine kinase